MKSTRMILSGAALFVSLVGSFAFKASKNGATQLFSKATATGACSSAAVSCFTASVKGSGNGCTASHLYFTQATCPTASRWLGAKTSND